MTDDQGDAMTKNNLDHASRCVVYAEGQLHSPITRERGAALSLDDLSAKRDAMGLGLLEECCYEQPESHSCRLVWSGDVPVFYLGPGDDERVKKATVRGLVAEHNAMPVLIEVTRAALRLRAAGRSASRARQGGPWTASSQSAEEEVSRTNAEWRAAHEALDDALAKVTCSAQAAPPEDPPASRPAPQRSSTKTDATGILHLLKAWSLAAFNGGRLYTSNFQEWWARHQDSAERMLARELASSTGESPLDPMTPPTDLKSRSTIAVLAMLRERRRQLREATSVGPDGEPMTSDAEVVAYRRLVAELHAEVERRNHDQK